jgi:5-methylcytosine-specific restriction endonuclease McrA
MYTQEQKQSYMREWRKKNREAIQRNMREWKRKERATRTPDKQAEMNAYFRKYYAEHKDHLKQNILKNHAALSTDEQLSRRRAITERVRLRRRANPLKMKIANAKRRSRINHVCDGTITTKFLQSLIAETLSCPYCHCLLDGNDQHFDHKHPIALGGLHTQSNIVLCCGLCNRSKGSLPYNIWMERLASVNKS